MPRSYGAWHILHAVRAGSGRQRMLHDVLKEIFPDSDPTWLIPSGTIGTFISGTLVDLAQTRIITVSYDRKRYADEAGGEDEFTLFFKRLGGDVRGISLKLSDEFIAMQSLLGISIANRVNFSGRYSVRVAPVFGQPEREKSGEAFVIMPFDELMRPVYEDHIKIVCTKIGLECSRADDIFASNEIMRDVWSKTFHADIVIADCTGKNPNVFYEMGIAHTLGKEVIIITQNEHDVPFDIRHRRFLKYEYTPRGMKVLEKKLRKAIKECLDRKQTAITGLPGRFERLA
jgi:hypothetical protein